VYSYEFKDIALEIGPFASGDSGFRWRKKQIKICIGFDLEK
jgi:hypothetical protein